MSIDKKYTVNSFAVDHVGEQGVALNKYFSGCCCEPEFLVYSGCEDISVVFGFTRQDV